MPAGACVAVGATHVSADFRRNNLFLKCLLWIFFGMCNALHIAADLAKGLGIGRLFLTVEILLDLDHLCARDLGLVPQAGHNACISSCDLAEVALGPAFARDKRINALEERIDVLLCRRFFGRRVLRF